MSRGIAAAYALYKYANFILPVRARQPVLAQHQSRLLYLLCQLHARVHAAPSLTVFCCARQTGRSSTLL